MNDLLGETMSNQVKPLLLQWQSLNNQISYFFTIYIYFYIGWGQVSDSNITLTTLPLPYTTPIKIAKKTTDLAVQSRIQSPQQIQCNFLPFKIFPPNKCFKIDNIRYIQLQNEWLRSSRVCNGTYHRQVSKQDKLFFRRIWQL